MSISDQNPNNADKQDRDFNSDPGNYNANVTGNTSNHHAGDDEEVPDENSSLTAEEYDNNDDFIGKSAEYFEDEAEEEF